MVLMATFDEFETKTMRAFDLQPQKGKHIFLPGKGWGTEIAIQYPVYRKTDKGYIERKKDPICFQARGYRSHSDFEMYGMQPGLKARDLYTPEFYKEFGAQEYFKTTKPSDRGSENVSREELWDNTEITILPNGKKITTLSLEYLLVEKLVEHPEFEQPNNHGRDISDAGALAMVYSDIDREKVKAIFAKNYVDYQVKKLKNVKDFDQDMLQEKIETVKGSIKKIDLFFEAVDKRKEELKRDEKNKGASRSSKSLKEVLGRIDVKPEKNTHVSLELKQLRQADK